ncbi:MAG: hypothetical protein IH991_04685 [Planctomycetes bacterium]|nr:hypothetical protein [Planctomycetota bacterium]
MIETRNPDGDVSYWKETTRPLTSLVFVIPFILIYEVGVLLLNADERNGIEHYYDGFCERWDSGNISCCRCLS